MLHYFNALSKYTYPGIPVLSIIIPDPKHLTVEFMAWLPNQQLTAYLR